MKRHYNKIKLVIKLALTFSGIIGFVDLPENLGTWVFWFNAIPDSIWGLLLGVIGTLLCQSIFPKCKQVCLKGYGYVQNIISKIAVTIAGVPFEYWFSSETKVSEKRTTQLKVGHITIVEAHSFTNLGDKTKERASYIHIKVLIGGYTAEVESTDTTGHSTYILMEDSTTSDKGLSGGKFRILPEAWGDPVIDKIRIKILRRETSMSSSSWIGE